MPDSLVLEPRVTGKTKFARDLRKAGLIPGVLYGRGAEPVSFQVDVPSLREALSGEAGRHAVLKLKVPGVSSPTSTSQGINYFTFDLGLSVHSPFGRR